MSHRRAPGVPDVPPFRGAGPLQARGVPNQTVMTDPKFIASKAAPAPPSKAMPPPRTTNQNSTSNQQRRPQPISNPSRDSKASSSSSSSQQSRSNRANAESEPRPSSRLANEKKKDYKDPPFIGPWKLGKLIGQGASGRVRHAINTSTGMQAAIKIVPKQILASSRMSIRDVSAKQDKMTLGIEREIVIMKLIEHPNVMGLMDVYETSKELYLILEYVAGGELFDYLVSKGRLRPPEARAYFRQIIFGLHYCHSFNICHRDLKPENLLLDGSKRIVKVADFGMAALQPNEKMLETSCGSPHYASPEIVSGKSYKGTASDIWSCGIILFALLCGRLPFDDPNIQTLLGKVRLGKFDMPDYLESQAKDLIWKMLTVDPEKRLKMRDIMRHPWFTDNGQLSSTNPVSTDLDKLAEEELDMNNLDLDILSNLKTLWPEYSQQDIIDQLMSKGPNWQKTFYSLLVQHRENYSGDDEDDDDDEDEEELLKSSQGKGNSLGLSLGISQPSPSKTSEQRPVSPAIVSPKITPSVMQNVRPNPTSSPRPISMIQAPYTPSVAQSPVMTSGRTMGSPQVERTMNDENRRPISMVVSPPGSPRRPLPSPKASPVKTMQSPASGFGSAKHAQQALQQQPPAAQTSPIRPVHDRARSDNVVPGRSASPTTPNRSRMRSSSVAEDSTPKQATASSNPPRPSSRASTMRPQSAQGQRNEDGRSNGTQLPSPAIGNTNMQQFFREIADELASIRVNGERPLSLQRKLEQLERMAAEVRSEARSQSPVGKQRSPRRDDDLMAQFDDAEDDVEDAYSVRSGTASEASSNPYSPPTPMTDTYSPALKTKPLAVLDKEIYNGGRMPGSIAMSSGNGSTPGTRTTSVQSSSTTQSNSSTGSGNSLGRRRSLLLGRIKSQRNKTQSAPPATAQGNTAYERLQEAGAKTQQQQGTRMQSRNPGLGLDIGSPALGNVGIKSPTLSVYSAISTGSAPPTPSTPGSVLMTPGSRSSSSHTGGSPKQSWFAGLFNWKPATCTLMSVENFSTTHAETKRLLQSCGARVFVEDSENSGVLKCSLAEKHTMQGNNQTSGQYAESQHSTSSSAKPIRFRVEFQILPMSSINSPAIGSNTPRSIGTSASPRIPNNSFTVNNGNGTVYATSITLVQEKGSLSTFKQIYHSLRELWTLDLPLNSPTMNSSSPAATAGNTLSPTFAATHSPAGIAKVGLGVSMRGASAEHGNNVGGGMTSPRFR